jgi:hypothetical protein
MTTQARQKVIESALGALPTRLANPGPELRIRKLAVHAKAQYVAGRLLHVAHCNVSESNGDEIHGRWSLAPLGAMSHSELTELVRHINMVIDKVIPPEYTRQIKPYNMKSNKGITPVDAYDITLLLVP